MGQYISTRQRINVEALMWIFLQNLKKLDKSEKIEKSEMAPKKDTKKAAAAEEEVVDQVF